MLATWVVYWVLLATVFAAKFRWSMLIAYLRNTHGEFTLSYPGSGLGPALVILGPPLLLALLWIATRPRAEG